MRQMRTLAKLLLGLLLLGSVAAARGPNPIAPAAAAAAPQTAASPPNRIIIGAYINDIHRIDLANNNHYLDMYIWFRWPAGQDNPVDGIDFMNWTNASDHSSVNQYETPITQPDGSLYTVLHHQGAFANKFSLENYPFDRQMLKIEIEDSQFAMDQRLFVVDPTQPVLLDPVIHLPGYEFGAPTLTVAANRYRTNFGDLNSTDPSTYSRATILIPVTRPWISGVFKVLLPIGLILISAILSLAVRPDHVEARIGLGITALLTMVALQFTATAGLPEVSYLMLIDKVYIASYLVIIAVLAMVVQDSWSIEDRGVGTVARRNRRAIVALVVGYLLFVAFLVGGAMVG
jgi:hypothetical protein